MDKKVFSSVLITILVIAVIGATAALWFAKDNLERPGANSEYQAVFLSSGQVYFGKIKSKVGDTVLLTNIYYLQSNADVEGNIPEGSPAFSLVKLGDELHSPQDRMEINKDYIMYIEDLQDDSAVIEAINSVVKTETSEETAE